MASSIPPTCTFSRELKPTVVFLGLVVFVALIESLPRGHKHMLIFHSAGWIAYHFTPACSCQICFFFTFKALGNDNMSLTLKSREFNLISWTCRKVAGLKLWRPGCNHFNTAIMIWILVSITRMKNEAAQTGNTDRSQEPRCPCVGTVFSTSMKIRPFFLHYFCSDQPLQCFELRWNSSSATGNSSFWKFCQWLDLVARLSASPVLLFSTWGKTRDKWSL